jgi:hypothetical protein
MTEAAMYHGAIALRFSPKTYHGSCERRVVETSPNSYDLTPRHRADAIALFPLPYCKNSLGESGAVVRRLSGFS